MSDSSLKSSLLVAMPQLLDPNFKRAVVLLVHHDEQGTFGLVVNRPLNITAGEFCRGIECKWNGAPDESVFCGGPVQTNTGWVLFDRRDLRLDFALEDDLDGVTEVGDDLLFAGSVEVLRAVAESAPRDTRLFLGYAGWGEGQLEDELSQGAWLVAPLSADAIFEVEPDSVWDFVVRSMGIDPATLVSTRGIH